MNGELNNKGMLSIMIVDDNPTMLQLLSEMLRDNCYKVRLVTSGALALETARRMPPSLILLDIDMPEMNGYEVCEQLKADAVLSSIPVIFLSALSEMDDKLRAFGVGGVDYITKPFQFEEVHARVECQLNILRLRQNLERRNCELAESNRRLHESELLRDNLINMVVHDMRSPLIVQMGFLELIKTQASSRLEEEERDWVAAAYEASFKITNMVNSLLDISRLEAGKMPIDSKPNDLSQIARAALDFFHPLIGQRQIALRPLRGSIRVDCDAFLVQRVIENLIGNALKFTADTGSVSIDITQDKQESRVSVVDNGIGIMPEDLETIFMKFSQSGAQPRRNSTGVGLAFCKMAVEVQGGQIGVNSEPGKGSTFWFTLPREEANGAREMPSDS